MFIFQTILNAILYNSLRKRNRAKKWHFMLIFTDLIGTLCFVHALLNLEQYTDTLSNENTDTFQSQTIVVSPNSVSVQQSHSL